MNKNLIILIWVVPIIMVLQSCISNKDYIYLQNKGSKSNDSINTYIISNNEYHLKPGDILHIKVVTEDEKMNSIFNPLTSGNLNMMQQQGTGTPFYIMGYSLDKHGILDLPYIGKIDLKGKTIEEAKFLLETEAKKYFKNFFIQIKIAEFRFSILGSVNRPGQFFFMVNKLNILEALAMSGDVNEIAKRNKLTLIREIDGVTNLYTIDLTDKNLLNSPYYYIHPNDIIYVQPVKSRSLGNLSNFQGTLSAVLPIFSTFLLVLNTYIILQNLK
ncbi:MAG: polysaccharide biosynthesis/export family protein [Bacteroidia bacterium]